MNNDIQIVIDLFKNDIPTYLIKKYHLVGHLLKMLSENEETVFMLTEEVSWNKILNSNNAAEALTAALIGLERNNPFFEKVFDDIDFYKFKGKILRQFIEHINAFGKFDPKFINYVLDSYIQREGYKAEVYKESDNLISLIIKLLNIEEGMIYDGTAGTNSFLIEAYHFSKTKKLELYAQEKNYFTWSIGKLLLAFNNLNEENITAIQADALQEPFSENTKLIQFDGIISDPPSGLKNWGEEFAQNDEYNRYPYGLPPKSSADWAFISHYIASLKETGKAVLIVPLGALFRGAKEGGIRSAVIKADLIETIVDLPPNILAETAIKIGIIIINKNKTAAMKNKILFINAEENCARQGNKNVLLEEHVTEIVHTYETKSEREGFSVLSTIDEIQENEFNLMPIKYFKQVDIDSEFGTVQFNKKKFENLEKVVLGKIATIQRGFNVVSKEDLQSDTYLVNLSDVDEEINFDNLKPVEASSKQYESYSLQSGDILISSRGTKNTKIIVVPQISKKLVFSSNFLRLRVNNFAEWHPYYIKLFLDSPVGQFFIKSSQTGSMVAVLSAKDIEKITIPFKTYKEQESIATHHLAVTMRYRLELLGLQQKQAALALKTYDSMGLTESFKIQSGKTASIIKLMENVLYKNIKLIILVMENQTALIDQMIHRLKERFYNTLPNEVSITHIKNFSLQQGDCKSKMIVVVPSNAQSIETLEKQFLNARLNTNEIILIDDQNNNVIQKSNDENIDMEKRLKELAINLGDISYVPATTALYL